MIGVCSVGIRLGESNYNCYGFVSPSMPLFEWVVADQATEERGETVQSLRDRIVTTRPTQQELRAEQRSAKPERKKREKLGEKGD